MSQRTIEAHISTLRNLLKLHSDDSNFTDQYLYKLLTDARATLLRRRSDKRNTIAPYAWQTICVPLEESLFHNCDCIDVGCTVLKSTIKIPHVLMTRNKPQIKVLDLAGRALAYTDEMDLMNNQYSKVKASKPTWTIIGDYLYVFNELHKEYVMIRGVFEDPFELSTITTCGDNNDTACYDLVSQEFPLDGDLNQAMYKMVAEMLSITFGTAPDETNDARSNN